MNEQIKHDPREEPIVISKVTMDILLKEDHSPELIALYSFYYYTSKWQDTNQARATNGYVAKKFKWSIPKVIKFRQVLERLGLIKTIVHYDPKTHAIKGHYVKVNFFWIKPVLPQKPNESPSVTKYHTMGDAHTNASEALILNSSEDNKEEALIDSDLEKPDKKEISPSKASDSPPTDAIPATVPPETGDWSKTVYKLWFEAFASPPTKWAYKQIRPLAFKHGEPTIRKVLKYYLDHQDRQFASISNLCNKWSYWLDRAGGPEKTEEEKRIETEAYFRKPSMTAEDK